MATTSNVLTFAAFEQLPDGDGFHRELIEGELQILPPPKSRHILIASNAYELLRALKGQGIGRVLMEAGYKLSDNPPTWVQPDVSFVKQSRVQTLPKDGYFAGAPDLAIEVVSPSESVGDLQKKVSLMLKAGCLAVWVIYPEERTVQIYRADGSSYTADTLTAPELLAGWEAPVSSLFDQITD